MSRPKILFPGRTNYTPVKLGYVIINTDCTVPELVTLDSCYIKLRAHGDKEGLGNAVLELFLECSTSYQTTILSSHLFFI